ncbi:Ig-like domain-containing protein [Exiguobacterium profundum]|uniref:Ig-like domain-containing protein n=1 Tax=Exiguobacterium profundum TaxID=307643 RepID=UPI002AA75471|nr:hypothetical protein [Exiguobacterium profundum]
MAKKKQFVTAAAAFAVAASAVAPAITADAASTTVQLSSDYVRGGDLDAALDKEYKGSEIYWYKSSVDMNKLGVFQTAKGFVKGQGIRVEKKLRVLNHAQDIQPEEIVLEEGVPASGLRIQPVLFADGVKYNKVVTYKGFSTEKAGEFEGTFTYSNKAFGVVTKTVKYKVVKSEVEISNVSSSVDQAAEVLSVTADVKNLKDGEKVELVVYPGKDMSATPIKADATVKDGKLTVSQKLPAGTHSFQLVSGEVKSAVVDFTIEAPMVKEVKAINAKELTITFNKAIKKDTIINSNNELINASLTAVGSATALVGPLKASLSEDGQTVTVTATTAFKGQYAVTVQDAVKSVNEKAVKAYSAIVNAEDTVRPMVESVTYSNYQTAVIKFSEPLKSLGTISANNADIQFGSLSADGKSVTVDLANANVKADTDYKVTIIGGKDFNDNLITPNPVEVTVKKSANDTVKPAVTALSTVNDKTFTMTFSEKLIANPTIKVNGDTVVTGAPGANQVEGTITKDASGLVYTVTLTNSVITSGTSALAKIEATYSDLSGNAGDAFSRIVEFKQDTVAPNLVNSTVEKINGKEYLVLNYDENVSVVDAKTINGKVVKDFVESTITPVVTDTVDGGNGVNFELNNPSNGKSKSVRLDLASLTSGAYTLTLPTGLVTDEAGVDSKQTTVSFTRTTNVDTGKPALTTAGTNGITKVNNDTYTVSFDRQLDPASALNVANYAIEGAVVKSAIFTQNDANGAVVRLTLEEGSIKLTGERTVTIQNVKSAAGVMMDRVSTTESLTENVKPTVASTQFVGLNAIKVVFSENIAAGTVDNSVVAANDFEVLIGDVAEVGATIAEDLTDTTGKTFTITLADDVTPAEYAKTITLKAGTGLNVTDESGNALVFTSASVAK